MISFPSIEQFKDIAIEAKARGNIGFTGTVKLHGSNAAVVFDIETEKVTCQSRNRILSIENDNADFAKFVASNTEAFEKILKQAAALCSDAALQTYSADKVAKVCMYGEWCGSGIQKGVGICQLPRMFVLFDVVAVMADKQSIWLSERLIRQLKPCPEKQIFSVYAFPTFRVEIDFAKPSAVLPDLEKYTLEVEKECPVAAALGIADGVGEGIVWKEEANPLSHFYDAMPLRFKTKGQVHRYGGADGGSRRSKPISLEQEVIDSIEEFISYAAHESRMLQGIEFLRESGLDCSKKNMGTFIGWCCRDIIKEESKAMEANGLVWKDVQKGIQEKLSKFYAGQFA